LANPEDARHYRALLDAYAADPLGQGRPLSPAVLDRALADLARFAGARIFLAGSGNEPTGFATCFLGYSTFRAAPLLNIHDIAVLGEYRGLGIARALLHTIAESAREEGCCKLTLEVRDNNGPARNLYRTEGFQAAAVNGEPVQYFFLEKLLTP
jgi:GNAT superfamily N-acetyltransferase